MRVEQGIRAGFLHSHLLSTLHSLQIYQDSRATKPHFLSHIQSKHQERTESPLGKYRVEWAVKGTKSQPGDMLTRPGSICQKWTPGGKGNECDINSVTSKKQQCLEMLLAYDSVSGKTSESRPPRETKWTFPHREGRPELPQLKQD